MRQSESRSAHRPSTNEPSTNRRHRPHLILGFVLALAAVPALIAASDWQDGVEAFRAGQLDEAAAAFARHVDRAPAQYQGHLMLGQVLLQQENAEQAVGHLQRANELAPGNAGVLLPLAQALGETNRDSEACAAAQQIDGAALDQRRRVGLLRVEVDAGCADDPLAHLEQIAQLAGNANSWAALGSEARRRGRTQQAVDAFDHAARLAPGDAKIRRSQFAALAEHAASLGDSAAPKLLERVVASAAEIVRLKPTTGHRIQLAEAHLLAGAPAAALGALEDVEDSWQTDRLRARALASEALQRHDQALAALDRALAQADSEDLASLHGQRGYSLIRLRRYDEAIAAYEAAGDDDAVAQVRAQQQIVAENAAIDAYNVAKQKHVAAVADAQDDLEDAKGPPR